MAYVDIKDIVQLSTIVETRFQTKFAAAIKSAAQLGNLLSTEITTKQRGANIPFINKWEGLENIALNGNPTGVNLLAEYTYKEIERYARFIGISVYDWHDPAVQSILMQQLDALVAEASWRRTRAIANALVNGNVDVTSYDDKNIFANDHDINGNTFDNLLAGALDADNYNSAKQVLRQIPLGPNGTYLPTEGAKFHLVIPPALEKDAKLLLRSTTIYEDNKVADNPFLQDAQLHVNSLLTDVDDWYLIMDVHGLKPFATIKHVTSKPALEPFISTRDVNVRDNKEYRWYCDMTEETYPIHYYLMVKSVN